MTLKQAYTKVLNALENADIDEAHFKALCLVCHINGVKNNMFNFYAQDEINQNELEYKLSLLLSGEPLQYVLGKWDFYESEFFVGRGVLIPRPETEELVDLAVNYLKNNNSPTVIDLCSGSGCIGISIAKKIKNSTVYCVEKSEDALYYLNLNANGVENVSVINADITKPLDLPLADIVVSNPPYIKTSVLSSLQNEVQKEPEMALDGGEDGLYFYRVINDLYAKNIKDGGALLLEIGDDQGESIKTALSNFSDIKVIKDLFGNDRMVVAKR